MKPYEKIIVIAIAAVMAASAVSLAVISKSIEAIESDSRAIQSESRDLLNVQNCHLLNERETEDAFYACLYGNGAY